VFGLESDDVVGLILSVGTQSGQRKLSPTEVARLLEVAKNNGASVRELAELVHLEGPTMIGRFMKLNALVPEASVMVDWGASNVTIGFSSAVEIARLPDAEQVPAAVSAIGNHLTRTEAKELVQLRLRSGRPLDDCVREVVGMRPRLERINVFLCKVAERAVSDQLGSLGQADRDALLATVLERECPELTSRIDVRLGVDSFIIAGDDSTAEVLRTHFVDLELEVTSLLNQELRPHVQ
jgi:hypothetical protein